MRQTLRFCLFCILFSAIYSSLLVARFNHRDADSIDSDRRLDTEYFLILKHYEPIKDWQSNWQDKAIGFRINTGSLGVNRSFFQEDVKFATGGEYVFFGLRRQGSEDLVGVTRADEISLGVAPFDFLKFFILADGGTYKKFADVGGRVMLYTTWLTLSSSLWSVDNYYNDKEDSSDRYEKKPVTESIELALRFPWLRVDASRHQDFPTVWQQDSRDLIYSYRKEWDFAKVRLGAKEVFYLEMQYRKESKIESLATVLSPTIQRKNLIRNHQAFDVDLVFSGDSKSYFSLGAFALDRDTVYRGLNLEESSDASAESIFSNEPSIARVEQGMSTSFHHSVGGSNTNFFLWRLSVAEVSIKEATAQSIGDESQAEYFDAVDTPRTESIFQWSWNIYLQHSSRILISTLWDLDQVERDFPYSEKPFSPFSGFNVQFQFSL